MSRIAVTTTPLDAADEWDSGILIPGLADRVVGSVFADEAGTIYIEQSPDFTNWDISTSYAVAASDGKGFSEEIILSFVRIRYVNGGTDQTEFRLTVRMTSAGPR